MTDALSLDFGAIYEFPIDSSDATFTLDIPGAGTSDVDGELSPSGFVFFIGISYYF
jgi:hypothetical protein